MSDPKHNPWARYLYPRLIFAAVLLGGLGASPWFPTVIGQ